MYKTLEIMGETTYQLVPDFFHQQYYHQGEHNIPKSKTSIAGLVEESLCLKSFPLDEGHLLLSHFYQPGKVRKSGK